MNIPSELVSRVAQCDLILSKRGNGQHSNLVDRWLIYTDSDGWSVVITRTASMCETFMSQEIMISVTRCHVCIMNYTVSSKPNKSIGFNDKNYPELVDTFIRRIMRLFGIQESEEIRKALLLSD